MKRLFFCMALLCSLTSYSQNYYGDVNHDGKIDVDDISKIVNMILNNVKGEEIQTENKTDSMELVQKQIEGSSLNGKIWAVCGDSFTYGAESTKFQSGLYSGKQKTYPYYIGNRTGIKICDFFDSGKTLAYPADETFHNSLCDPTSQKYFKNIPENVDYVTIYLGINDSHHATYYSTGIITLGTINDDDTSTYYGAWNNVMLWLRENRPFAHVGIIVSNGCDSDDYRLAQIAIAKKFGVPYIDLNGDSQTQAMLRSSNPNISQEVRDIITKSQSIDYDGSKTGNLNRHPTDKAHEFESWFIEDFIKRL